MNDKEILGVVAGWTCDHELKTWPEYFQAILDGKKRFEIRTNDRNFKVGQWLLLREWNPVTKEYTGRATTMEITYITGWEQPDGQIVMSIDPPTTKEALVRKLREVTEERDAYKAALAPRSETEGRDKERLALLPDVILAMEQLDKWADWIRDVSREMDSEPGQQSIFESEVAMVKRTYKNLSAALAHDEKGAGE